MNTTIALKTLTDSVCDPQWSWTATKNIEHIIGIAGAIITIIAVCRFFHERSCVPVIVSLARVIAYSFVIWVWSFPDKKVWTRAYYIPDILLLAFIMKIPHPEKKHSNIISWLVGLGGLAGFLILVGIELLWDYRWYRYFFFLLWLLAAGLFLGMILECKSFKEMCLQDLQCKVDLGCCDGCKQFIRQTGREDKCDMPWYCRVLYGCIAHVCVLGENSMIIIACLLQIAILFAKGYLERNGRGSCSEHTLEYFLWTLPGARVPLGSIELSLWTVLLAFLDVIYTEVTIILAALRKIETHGAETADYQNLEMGNKSSGVKP